MSPNGHTFRSADLLFRCFWRDDEHTYQWRTDCGSYAVQREGRAYKARAGARLLGDRYTTLAAAMGACVAASIGRQGKRAA